MHEPSSDCEHWGLTVTSRFCPDCGASRAQIEAPPASTLTERQGIAGTASRTPENVKADIQRVQKRKAHARLEPGRRRKWFWLGALAAIAVVVLAVIVVKVTAGPNAAYQWGYNVGVSIASNTIGTQEDCDAVLLIGLYDMPNQYATSYSATSDAVNGCRAGYAVESNR